MLTINGSHGEGGGQILRSSLALSIATGQPFRIEQIRAGRPKPGLMRQHLTCVQAAAAICCAEVTGDSVGSTSVTFNPGPITPGAYHFSIGTAGGTALVLQAILPPLLRAGGPSRITIEGGTHAKAAPPFEFLDRTLLPILNRTGACITAKLERHGFYPAGGGRIVVEISPSSSPIPLDLTARGHERSRRATAIVSRIGGDVAQRELAVLSSRLSIPRDRADHRTVTDSPGPGNAAFVELAFEHTTEVFSVMGEPGRSAEKVAHDLADEVANYLRHDQPVGPHLADQLMVPLALVAGGRYATGPLTEHTRTNLHTMGLFDVSARLRDLASGFELVIPPWNG